jgi:putative PIN family toxin of toxin-antitoxin system
VLKAVLDTNVIVAALQSSTGASNSILRQLGLTFTHLYSNALLYEYEEVITRLELLSPEDLQIFLTFFVQQGIAQLRYVRLRPQLNDPKDEHILELAFNARADCIVTFNIKDFQPARSFGIEVLQPKDFLNHLGGKK